MRENSTAISPETIEELRIVFREELQREGERRRDRKTLRTRLWKDFSEELKAADEAAETAITLYSVIGNPPHAQTRKAKRYQVRSAISTLLRAVYRVEYVEWLPADKELEMREFIRSVLNLMKDLKGGDAHENAI